MSVFEERYKRFYEEGVREAWVCGFDRKFNDGSLIRCSAHRNIKPMKIILEDGEYSYVRFRKIGKNGNPVGKEIHFYGLEIYKTKEDCIEGYNKAVFKSIENMIEQKKKLIKLAEEVIEKTMENLII